MSYLNFNKEELINLEYSLSREVLRSNRAGTYASTSLAGCNTRKYHGLLICPIENFNHEQHVLLSGLDLSIIYNSGEFNLGIHQFEEDVFHPKGHKYIQDFETEDIPQIYYRIGGVRIVRESLLVEKEQQILIRYTILEADKPIKLKFSPFLAFRNIHQLSKANLHVNSKVKYIANGISTCMYAGYPNLNMQFSKNTEFVHVPDWYYNVEYSEEKDRGYEHKEDLYVPGYFETDAKKGESIVFSAGTKEALPSGLKRKFTQGIDSRIPRNSFKNCLLNSADQFILESGKNIEIKAGYPWIDSRSRDTFISLPGLTLANGNTDTFFKVLDTQISRMKKGLFPRKLPDCQNAYDSADASLWFFWALQQYYIQNGNAKLIWKKYGKSMKNILSFYKKGANSFIHMQENGLLYAGEMGVALTWMDASVSGRPVTPRNGLAVEINALWYNAICFSLEMAEISEDKIFLKSWTKFPKIISESFKNIFWDESKGYLADYVNGNSTDWSIRPNQIIAAALPNSPIEAEIRNSIVEKVKQYLLTPRGLRSLAPQNEKYKGIYGGNEQERDTMYHQGTAWPWLLEHYCEAFLQLHNQAGLSHIKKIVSDFEAVVDEHGIGTISELYDGNPPHAPKGTVSQAWSVAALLRIIEKIEKLESTK